MDVREMPLKSAGKVCLGPGLREIRQDLPTLAVMTPHGSRPSTGPRIGAAPSRCRGREGFPQRSEGAVRFGCAGFHLSELWLAHGNSGSTGNGHAWPHSRTPVPAAGCRRHRGQHDRHVREQDATASEHSHFQDGRGVGERRDRQELATLSILRYWAQTDRSCIYGHLKEHAGHRPEIL